MSEYGESINVKKDDYENDPDGFKTCIAQSHRFRVGEMALKGVLIGPAKISAEPAQVDDKGTMVPGYKVAWRADQLYPA